MWKGQPGGWERGEPVAASPHTLFLVSAHLEVPSLWPNLQKPEVRVFRWHHAWKQHLRAQIWVKQGGQWRDKERVLLSPIAPEYFGHHLTLTPHPSAFPAYFSVYHLPSFKGPNFFSHPLLYCELYKDKEFISLVYRCILGAQPRAWCIIINK